MSRPWYNLAVPALTVAYFFVVSVLAALPVWLGYRLQKDFHRAWLFPYTLYLAGWGVFVLLSVVQYMLIGSFLPQPQWDQVGGGHAAALRHHAAPSRCTSCRRSWHSSPAGGCRAPTRWPIGWCGVLRPSRSRWRGRSSAIVRPEALSAASSFVAAVLKLGLTYGWIAYAPFHAAAHRGPARPPGSPRFVLLLAGGFLAFDLAVRDVAGVRDARHRHLSGAGRGELPRAAVAAAVPAGAGRLPGRPSRCRRT